MQVRKSAFAQIRIPSPGQANDWRPPSNTQHLLLPYISPHPLFMGLLTILKKIKRKEKEIRLLILCVARAGGMQLAQE